MTTTSTKKKINFNVSTKFLITGFYFITFTLSGKQCKKTKCNESNDLTTNTVFFSTIRRYFPLLTFNSLLTHRRFSFIFNYKQYTAFLELLDDLF